MKNKMLIFYLLVFVFDIILLSQPREPIREDITANNEKINVVIDIEKMTDQYLANSSNKKSATTYIEDYSMD